MKTGVDLNRIEWSEHLSLSGFVFPGPSSWGGFWKITLETCDKWGLDKNVELVTGATDSNAFYASEQVNLETGVPQSERLSQ